MFYIVLLLSFFASSVQAMEQSIDKYVDDQEKPVIIWALHDVLIKPSADDLWLPTCFTPKSLEKDLIEAVRMNSTYTNEKVTQRPGILPLGIKAWLLDYEENEKMITIARAHMSKWTQPILYSIAGEAFTPKKAASYLKPIKEVLALARTCQQQGCQSVLASSWNSECFAEVENQHPAIFSPFEEVFTSGQPGNPGTSTKLNALTSERAFFEQIKEKLGRNRHYLYVDVAENKESLETAEAVGVKTCALPSDSSDIEFKESGLKLDAFKAHKLILQLVKKGLIRE